MALNVMLAGLQIILVKCSLVTTRDFIYRRDAAPLYIVYVMLIWAAPIPADRFALQSMAIANSLG